MPPPSSHNNSIIGGHRVRDHQSYIRAYETVHHGGAWFFRRRYFDILPPEVYNIGIKSGDILVVGKDDTIEL